MDATQVLSALWQRLATVQQLTLRVDDALAQAAGRVGQQQAHGTVQVAIDGTSIVFTERVLYENGQRAFDGKSWQFDDEGVTFGRQRHAGNEPIFRFVPCESGWRMEQEYWCAPDCYRGQLWLENDVVRLCVEIAGSHKAQTVWYEYR